MDYGNHPSANGRVIRTPSRGILPAVAANLNRFRCSDTTTKFRSKNCENPWVIGCLERRGDVELEITKRHRDDEGRAQIRCAEMEVCLCTCGLVGVTEGRCGFDQCNQYVVARL